MIKIAGVIYKGWCRAVGLVVCAAICLSSCNTATNSVREDADNQRFVVDSLGETVYLPDTLNRVITISDGFIEGVLTVFGRERSIVGLGSTCLVREFSYEFTDDESRILKFTGGMNPLLYLNPWFKDVPLVIRPGTGMNYEKVVSLKPDVVIIRVGDCTIDFRDSAYANMKGVFESLGIPVVTLLASHLNEQGTLMCIDDEIRILGQVFNTADEAERLIAYLHHSTADFTQRIHIQKPEKPPEVLLLGLSPSSRNRGGAANVMGLNTIESHILEDILLAKNAFRERGYFRILNVENILKLNPDAIVLHTSSGYHPAQELLASPSFKIFRGLKAVRNKRVAALPWSPCNCDKRLEYPIDIMVMAVTAYPEMFEDINLERWLLDFYIGLYQVDEPTARALIKCQWMEWISR